MQKLVDEITLSFAGYFGCHRDFHHAVVAGADTLFEFKQPHFDILLIGDVVTLAVLAEIAVVSHPLEKSVLSDRIAVLRDYLCEFSDKAS